MKTNITLRVTFMAFILSYLALSCTKEGDVGPRGERGEQGERGASGERGVAGADGSRIFSGSGVPAASLGNLGDFYFRTSNSDFYGPKAASGWGSPTNLRGATGATGATGAAGSKILSGTAVPVASLGANNDFYFRTTTADFYGPKTDMGWGTPINLKGVKGEDGSKIYSGTSVPAIALGNVGDFYFRTTTGDFYGPKTASSWGTPTSLKGATGATGATGTPGSKILSGASVPTTAIGAVGDYYIHTGTGNLYGPKTANGWGSAIMNLRGAQGPAGPQGPPGKDGQPGTANVIYSNWHLIDTYIQQGYGITAPQLTQTIIDRGQVLVYRRYNDGKVDYVEQLGGESSGASIWYFVQPGNIFIYYNSRLTTLVSDGYHAVRYVLIPGSVQANTYINVKNFDQVKAAFNIPD